MCPVASPDLMGEVFWKETGIGLVFRSGQIVVGSRRTAERVRKMIDPVTLRKADRGLARRAAVAAESVAWLVTGAALAAVAVRITAGGWDESLWWLVLCGSGPAAVWTARRVRAARDARALLPPDVLGRRYHGSLAVITDTERRSLRSIGASSYEVATRTGVLLAGLTALPGVRIFLGVRPAGTHLPPTPHAVSAGRQLVLVESVAWPQGCYRVAASGEVLCDDVYIGQSTQALTDAVRHWRQALPRGCQVTAMVVVHPPARGSVSLPAAGGGVVWLLAGDAAASIHRQISTARRPPHRSTVAVLVSATALNRAL